MVFIDLSVYLHFFTLCNKDDIWWSLNLDKDAKVVTNIKDCKEFNQLLATLNNLMSTSVGLKIKETIASAAATIAKQKENKEEVKASIHIPVYISNCDWCNKNNKSELT